MENESKGQLNTHVFCILYLHASISAADPSIRIVLTFGIKAWIPTKLIFKLSSPGGLPMATIASEIPSCLPTEILSPFISAPYPFIAVNNSSR